MAEDLDGQEVPLVMIEVEGGPEAKAELLQRLRDAGLLAFDPTAPTND